MNLSLLVIVLHYSGVDDTRECLASLESQAGGQVHVLVVENGAIEPLGPSFAAEYPWAEIQVQPENLGWAGGNNLGIRLAQQRGIDVVCLLNNDTVLPPRAFERLLDTAQKLDRFILHPVIDSYGADEPPQLDPAIPEPLDMTVRAVSEAPGVFRIGVVNGACLLAPTELFTQIGLIDARFFLLYEDADLGQRARAAGYGFYCDTGVRIRHKESRSFGGRRRPIKTYYAIRNRLLFEEKHPPAKRTWRQRYASLAHSAAGAVPQSSIALVVWTLSGDQFARAFRMAVRDYLLRRFGRINPRDQARLA